MATKATIANVLAEGFGPAMFGDAKNANFDTPDTGVVQQLLNRAENFVKDKLTAANFALLVDPSYPLDCVVCAETYFAAYQLWIRRIAFLDASATTGLEADKKAALLKQARANAEAAQADMAYWLAEAQRAFGMDVQADQFGTGVSSGIVETGPFRQTIGAALNFGGAQ